MHTAMILAAGRGTRLKPMTNYLPKALCQVGPCSLIEHHLLKLKQAGYQKVVINHAHLGGLIRNQLGTGSQFGLSILYAAEPPGGLETGGGLVHALELLGEGPFLVINADVYSDVSYTIHALRKNRLAHLILVPKPSDYAHADFTLSAKGMVETHSANLTFSGIACYHRDFFNGMPNGRYGLAPYLRKHAQAGYISGEIHEGLWLDTGNHERLRRANLLANKLNPTQLAKDW